MYLLNILNKYAARDLSDYRSEIITLINRIAQWAGNHYINTYESGSRPKGTATSIASDVDYLVSLRNGINLFDYARLEDIYNSLYIELQKHYQNVRKQNVSIRIELYGRGLLDRIEVDITPGRKHPGNTNDHSLYVSKENTWKKTNIQRHINDVKQSGRTNEIKLLKVWRELNELDFPSIYLEYLVITDILHGKPIGLEHLSDNLNHILNKLAKPIDNPLLSSKIIDPANQGNILSNLLSQREKDSIRSAAYEATRKTYWNEVFH